jgi:hypothetical protein
VGHGEAYGAVDLGRKRAEGEVPRRPELTAASMGAAARWKELGTSWASKLSGQMKRGEATGAIELKRGRDKASLRRNCGGGRSSGVRCWQLAGDVALGRTPAQEG